MFKMNRRSILKSSAITAAAAAMMPKWAKADTGTYTAADLNGVLTPFGGLRAGNADNSIPAWTGGYSTIPDGYVMGDRSHIPFADEQPLFIITSANLDQYKDKIPAGALGVFAKYPDYRMEVFPTHRTAIAPQFVYDYIAKNAVNAKLSTDGNAVTGAYGGIPFPIPTNGHQVMWNHLLAWSGTSAYFESDAHTITASGQIVFESRVKAWFQYPYYVPGGESTFNGFFLTTRIVPIAPPFEAGASIMQLLPVDPIQTPDEAFLYLAGERRVRRAPELQYDTPNSLTGGTTNWDEADIFAGQLDEYDCNLLGKKEMFVPYNTNKASAASPDQQFLPHFVNPDITRWELHRVYVVEMTVKAGARNVDARRVIYADEDTGSALMGEVYDANGSLWKFMHVMPTIMPDVPCLQAAQFFITYELHAGDYSAGDHYSSETQPQWKIIPNQPETFFTPGQLAASAGGF